MPLKDCPFTKLTKERIPKPRLPVSVINPDTGLFVRTFALIDTGADECAVPADFAALLGHNFEAGSRKTIITGNGESIAFSHTTTFIIYHPSLPYDIAYTIPNTPIDFMPNLPVVLLGVKSFLSKFILNIDYPREFFSIRYPQE